MNTEPPCETFKAAEDDADMCQHCGWTPAAHEGADAVRAALRGVQEEPLRKLIADWRECAENIIRTTKHHPDTAATCLLQCANELEAAALRGVGTPQEKAQRQELINDLYRLFTMTTQEIAAEFGEARCKDDSARINYALELLADHVTDCATATDEPFFKPNADFKQVKDWVKAVPLSTPHQEEKAP